MARHSREELAAFVKTAKKAMIASFWQPTAQWQRKTSLDRPVRGARWVSRVVLPKPAESDARQILLDAIRDLGDGSERYLEPSLEHVQAQWVGKRFGVSKDDEPEPSGMDERSRFNTLTAETKSDLTIMYMYGGAHYINGPATRRAVATTLCEQAEARCIIIQHRHAPQSPFPAQLLDVLHAYLSLLYPPPSSFHAPVQPSSIVLAGDSSGGQLAASLVQILLSTNRRHASSHSHTSSLRFHGHEIPLPIPLPAGLAVQSPAFDHLGNALPTWDTLEPSDILPSKAANIQPEYTLDAVWPASPPRAHVYCETPTLAHPLVSPMLAPDWTGAPPIYIAIGGGERELDPSRVVARRAASQGVSVVWDEYELMPHNWPMILQGWPQSERCMQTWAHACREFAAGGQVQTRGTICSFDVDAQGKRAIRDLDVIRLTDISDDYVRKMAKKMAEEYDEEAREVLVKWKSRI